MHSKIPIQRPIREIFIHSYVMYSTVLTTRGAVRTATKSRKGDKYTRDGRLSANSAFEAAP